jgi:uncharacterized protein YkwD
LRRFALAAVIATAALPAPAAQARPCAGADTDPAAMTVKQIRAATICLLNVERRKRGRAALRHNPGLALAGQRHARDMVSRRYFAHVSRSGAEFGDRIRRTGYLRGGGRAVLGENLAWGGGRHATPRRIVRSWMRSPGHRANILQRRFREVGIGVVRRIPVGGRNRGATYAAEFGRTY